MADARRYVCKPIRSCTDPRLTDGDHRVLDGLCAHADTTTGEARPSVETLMRFAGGMTDRGIRKGLRRLEETGYLVTRREHGRNLYQVLYDEPLSPPSDTGTGVPPSIEKATPEPGFRGQPKTGTVVPEEGNEGSGVTGTPVPGERVNSTELLLTATDGAREDDRNGGSGVTTKEPAAMSNDTMKLSKMAIDLAVAANQALRDNPLTAAQASIYPLSHGSAMTPLKDWLDAGIPFEVILRAVSAACARFKPAQRGHRITRFTYFENPVREAWDRAQANAQVDAAPLRQISPAAPAPRALRALA